ncbi:hypothetical protein CAPTEDRAFT_206226 [Capitella teleta]|uniref:Uncharacterized protein n=1 Tax=Capitella teleta TaxID=283909 RepID=R7T5J0_CAPTE|nr:hypothetical protein CAPTEDRAFT_206226 [Capitella teleta]|eukprot:ELT88510.1 hypothetical protein CAPTEDRAFT_206226 [Capitella teleta]
MGLGFETPPLRVMVAVAEEGTVRGCFVGASGVSVKVLASGGGDGECWSGRPSDESSTHVKSFSRGYWMPYIWTMVRSHSVIQVAGVILMVSGVLGKIATLFVTMPDPIVIGILMVISAIESSIL